jgi:transcriptional regulator
VTGPGPPVSSYAGRVYLPETFREADRAVLFDLCDAHRFATLISGAPGSDLVVSHLPLLVDRGPPGGPRLLGHVARANPQWRRFDGATPALAIFMGPHGYVSPSGYVTAPSVPTWNYAVVHVTGRPRVVDGEATAAIVARLVEAYEAGRPGRWSGELPPDFHARQLEAIVGFEMSIDDVQGKFKLGQNRTDADRAGMIDAWERSEDAASRALAAFARDYYARRP